MGPSFAQLFDHPESGPQLELPASSGKVATGKSTAASVASASVTAMKLDDFFEENRVRVSLQTQDARISANL